MAPLSALVALLLVAGCGSSATKPGELMAFVGSASKPVLEELARDFERETGIRVALNFGGSGTMLSQMKLAKQGDIYLPGSPDFMGKAKEQGLVFPETERLLAYLIPAINVKKGNPKGIKGLSDLARPGLRVGIANPETVCVGLYAVEIMEHNGLADRIRPNIVTYTQSCEKTASAIAIEPLDAVMGWREFQSWDPERIETVLLRPEEIPRISYIPVAVSRYTRSRSQAERFIAFLESDRGKEAFRRWGYTVAEEEARRFAPQARIGGQYNLPEGW